MDGDVNGGEGVVRRAFGVGNQARRFEKRKRKFEYGKLGKTESE